MGLVLDYNDVSKNFNYSHTPQLFACSVQLWVILLLTRVWIQIYIEREKCGCKCYCPSAVCPVKHNSPAGNKVCFILMLTLRHTPLLVSTCVPVNIGTWNEMLCLTQPASWASNWNHLSPNVTQPNTGIQEVWLQPLPMPVITVYRLAAMKGKLQEKNKRRQIFYSSV